MALPITHYERHLRLTVGLHATNEGEENVCLPSGGEIVQPMYLLKEKAVSSYNVHLLLISRGPP